MIVTHKVTVDWMESGEPVTISVVQDDRYSRNLELTLLAGGESWDIPEDADVLVRYSKSDGTGGAYNHLPEGETAWHCEGNVLTVALAPEVTTAAGPVTLAISVILGQAQVTSFALMLEVQPLVQGVPESGEYRNILTVGSVQALKTGEAPTATITGTAEHPVLHLGIPCASDAGVEREITVEEGSGGYWDSQDTWNQAEGVAGKRTGKIPVTAGEGFLYRGTGTDNVPSCIWYDAVGNILSWEQYDTAQGVHLIRVPTGAEAVRFCSYGYGDSGENVVLEVVFLPKGDSRKVRYEEKSGGYWNTAGQWVESSGGSRRTNPILITTEDRIRYIGYGRWAAASVLWYDENGEVTASGMYCQEAHNRPTQVTLVPPEGAAYARFCSWDAENVEDVVLGVTLETEAEIQARARNGNVLYGRKYVACGDSYTAGDFTNAGDSQSCWDPGRQMYKTYPWWIAERNNMVLVNEAVCGSTMYANGADTAFSVSRVAQVPEDADYVTLCFGLNELDAPMGTLADTDNTTVLGAWNVALEQLITRLPYAKIGILIPDGGCTEEMRDGLQSVAAYWGIPCLDLKGDTTLPLLTGGRFGSVCEKAVQLRNQAFQISQTDGHPNVQGHQYRSTVIEGFLRGL